MLKQRVITATVFIVIVVAALVALTPFQFSLFIGALILIGAWEWSSLAGLTALAARGAYLLFFLALLIATQFLVRGRLDLILLLSLLWWAVACAFILSYPRYAGFWGKPAILAVAGVFVLVPAWLTFLYLRGQDNFVLLISLLVGAVAAVDIGAYFSGRAFGRNKLAPRVSPNKTWEGFWGGVAACCILIAALGLYHTVAREPLGTVIWVELLGFAVLLGVVSTVGDLLESMIKRLRDVKDSGSILPGHGGILDRIDSITAAAPVYALLVMSIGADLL